MMYFIKLKKEWVLYMNLKNMFIGILKKEVMEKQISENIWCCSKTFKCIL